MANDLIKPGFAVITRIGHKTGLIDSIRRHPISRAIVAVVIRPEGVTDPDEYFVTSPRNLRPLEA
jgi:hypothetical protein